MFGARNGASRPPSALAGHRQKPLPTSIRPTESDITVNALQRKTSSDSISSIGSTGNVGVHARTPQPPPTPRTNGPLSTQHQFQQQHNAPPVNKELNIQVVVRIRSRSEREVRENSPVAVQAQAKEILVQSTLGDRAPSKSYSFDRVFMYSDQECIYNEVVTPILDEVLTGYNCTIFAYGQTGTGKTFTMEGDLRDNFGECSRDAGIIPRTLYTLFAALERKNTEYTVRVSFLELYNEEVKDLLVPDDDRKVVKIFDSIKKQGPLVQGLEEVSVFNAGQGIEALRKGSAKRTVAATKSNDKSSRSHGVFSITVHVKETTDDGEELLKIGKLNLVDLAGSENIARSGAEATQAKEAGRINQSLLTLGRVINSLVERSQHIPYRESKLTRLLEDSLGGKTKTCIIATISPARSCLEETISTLNYANRAKNIKNTPEINQKMSKRTLIKEYLLEIDRLKSDLNATREKNGVFMTQESYQALLDESTSNKDLVGEQQKQVEKITRELARVEEKFRETMKLLTQTEHKLGLSNAELDAKRMELEEIQVELTKTKQVLKEEAILRQAHAHTENELNAVAAELRSTLATSVKDIRGLHEKLERKNMIERENREALAEFQEKLMDLSGQLGERIQSFSHNQGDLLSLIRQRIDKASQEATVDAEGAHAFLETQLERMSKAVEDFGAIDSDTSKKVVAFKNDFDALRLDMTEFLKSRVEASKANALRGFDGLKKALSAFSGLVERQQETTLERLMGIVDESTTFSKDSINRHQRGLDAYEKATWTEIEFLALQNQALKQQLLEQEAKKDQQKKLLLTEIGGLLDNFLKDQTGTLMGHFTKTCESLEDSTSRLTAAHAEQQAWTGEFERLGAQRLQNLVASRTVIEKEGVEILAKIAEDGRGLVARTGVLGSSIEEDLESQQIFMQTKMFDMNAKAMGGYEQMGTQHAVMAKMFSQTSSSTIAALKDLKVRATTTREATHAVHHETSDKLITAKNEMQLFGGDVHHNLEQSREELEDLVPRRLKVDDATGRTPSRRKYKYPHSWCRTRPSQDLLKEFRELGRVNMFTTDQSATSGALSESGDDIESTSSALDPGSIDMNDVQPRDAEAPVNYPVVDASGQGSATDLADSMGESEHVSSSTTLSSIEARSPLRTSQPYVGQEAEREKENLADAKVAGITLAPSNIARPVRPGKHGYNIGALSADLSIAKKQGKRSAADMESGGSNDVTKKAQEDTPRSSVLDPTSMTLAPSSLTPGQLPGPAFVTRSRPELARAAAAAPPPPSTAVETKDGTQSTVSYKILYLKLHGMAATARILLALSGVQWESIYPNNWTEEKKQVPLGVMPVLYEIHHNRPDHHHRHHHHSSPPTSTFTSTSQDTSSPPLVLEIPESEAIERYLSRKFSFLGSDLWEETAINVFYASSNAVMSLYVNRVLLAFPDTKQRELDRFVSRSLPEWIEQHERWLSRNDTNGHYVGDQLSLADIRSVVCLDRFMTIPECKDLFSLATTPGLFKLKETLERHPRYIAWIQSDHFEAINVSTRQRLAILSG
ncbi:kinesin motor protein cin8 [Mortierella claussenii]|nr:kinesin motor protein cin8 [Mortierella claussenii]